MNYFSLIKSIPSDAKLYIRDTNNTPSPTTNMLNKILTCQNQQNVCIHVYQTNLNEVEMKQTQKWETILKDKYIP